MLKEVLLEALFSPSIERNGLESKLLRGQNPKQLLKRSFQLAPQKLLDEVPAGGEVLQRIVSWKRSIRDILKGLDTRFLLIIGPSVIEDFKQGYRYAEKLSKIAKEVNDRLLVVMKASFSSSQKGLDDGRLSFTKLRSFFKEARSFLISVAELGVPCAVEFFDPITPHFINDLIVWSSVSEKTSLFCASYEVASSINCPVGIAHNVEDGIFKAYGILSGAHSAAKVVGVNQFGEIGKHSTMGNPFAHLVVQGFKKGGRKISDHLLRMANYLKGRDLLESIVIDCGEDPLNFNAVLNEVIRLIDEFGKSYIKGAILGAVENEPPLSTSYKRLLKDPSDTLAWKRIEGTVWLARDMLGDT